MARKIYSITDPRTGKVFYVGATSRSINCRLKSHIGLKPKNRKNNSIINRRTEYINEIIKSGYYPVVNLLEECSFDMVDQRESYFYNKFKGEGCELLQNSSRFNYSKIVSMVESKQMYAFINADVVMEVSESAKVENRSISGMVETLLMEALIARSNKKIRERKEKIK